MKRIITAESVTEGHPDKVCDQISDAILDALLEQDPQSRVACESFATTGAVFVMGEVTTEAYVDLQKIVRETIRRIGYTGSEMGFDADTCAVISSIHEQSPDIAQGVDCAYEVREGEDEKEKDPYDRIGAGDQGVVYGYASDESESGMPLPIDLAHKMARRLAQIRKEEIVPHLRPDGKTQVSVEYENGEPKRIASVLISTQHDAKAVYKELKEQVWKEVVLATLPSSLLQPDTKFFFNPTGKFEIGGPHGDTGLTGRKIIVDTYGGVGRSGGGAFSGKDPTKVDRSASYYARYAAKNMVFAGLAKKLEIGLSYGIGMAHPFSMYVDSFGTGILPDETLLDIVQEVFDFRPAAIIDQLQLRRPIYKQTAAYGHFGRTDIDLPWEAVDRVEELKEAANRRKGEK